MAIRIAWFGPVAAVVRRVVRRFGAADPALSWRLLRGPLFGNAVATLTFSDRSAEVIFEKSRPTGRLEALYRIELSRAGE